MNKKIEPVLEFEFQTIKLNEVSDLIPTHYRSKYEAIRQQVIEKIKSMAEDETFIFAPSKNSKGPKLDDNLISRICHGINTALVREALNWKIAFSDKAKAFVVAPYRRYKLKARGEYKVTAFRHQTNGNSANGSEQLEKLLKVTRALFGVKLKDLQIKLDGAKNPELSATKKAFVYVGRKNLGIKLSHIGKALQLTSASMTTIYKRAQKDAAAMSKVSLFVDALNERN